MKIQCGLIVSVVYGGTGATLNRKRDSQPLSQDEKLGGGALKKQEGFPEAGPLILVHPGPQGMWKENGQKMSKTKRTRGLSFQRGQGITYKAKNLPYQENTFYPDLPLFERELKSILSFLRKL